MYALLFLNYIGAISFFGKLYDWVDLNHTVPLVEWLVGVASIFNTAYFYIEKEKALHE